MTDLPTPLTPADCDLTDFQYMELDVRRLRDSKFASTPNGDAFRAGVLLWCAAWHQVPAASLPDDDIELANLAGYGRMPFSVKEWKKVRAEALYGFIKCDDGRLYHPIIAEKAQSAYSAKLKHAYDKFCDRLRKENSRRAKENNKPLGIPTFDQWNSGMHPNGIPPDSVQDSTGIPPERKQSSAGIPPENALKGNREGTERERNGEGTETLSNSVPIGTGASLPPEGLTAQEAVFQVAVPWLVANGAKESNVRSLLGGAVKQLGADGAWELSSECMREKPIEPLAWLAAGLNSRMLRLKKSGKGKPAALEDQQKASTDEARRLLFGNQGEVIDATA